MIPHPYDAQAAQQPLGVVNPASGIATLPSVVVFTNDGRAIVADAKGGIVWQVRGTTIRLADIVIPGGPR